MCIATPLKVLSIDSSSGLARCAEYGGQVYPHAIQTALLDQQPVPGDWLLAHVDTAIRSLHEAEAGQVANALAAVVAASRGDPFEHLLADLIDREPELPAHLRDGDASRAHLYDAKTPELNQR